MNNGYILNTVKPTKIVSLFVPSETGQLLHASEIANLTSVLVDQISSNVRNRSLRSAIELVAAPSSSSIAEARNTNRKRTSKWLNAGHRLQLVERHW